MITKLPLRLMQVFVSEKSSDLPDTSITLILTYKTRPNLLNIPFLNKFLTKQEQFRFLI